jgi:ABC-type sugar transport system permease subunit
MLAPFLILFTIFTIYPMIRSLYLSFTDYTGIPKFEILDKTVKALVHKGELREQTHLGKDYYTA